MKKQTFPFAELSYDDGVTVIEVCETKPNYSYWGGDILEDVRIYIKDDILTLKASKIMFDHISEYYVEINDETIKKYNLGFYKQMIKKKWFGFGKETLVALTPNYIELIERRHVSLVTNVFRIDSEKYQKDFGTKWNERMDELGAERGTVEDLLSI